jgi:hypothetical protein
MFRGFEKIMEGKDPQSGSGGDAAYLRHLRRFAPCIAPRRPWIRRGKQPCSPNALLLRAIGQATETIQSIPRWFYAIFATDLANKKFANKPLYAEVVKRFAAYVGTSFQKGVTASGAPSGSVRTVWWSVAALFLHGARWRDVRANAERHHPRARHHEFLPQRLVGARVAGLFH